MLVREKKTSHTKGASTAEGEPSQNARNWNTCAR